MNAIEQLQEHERALQHEKTPERPQRQKGLDGPSL
ncbi:Uncharacterised protein [Enterobacter hormaechei]|nr:Uncharacterised protein [Enterobacter hormaechei]